MGLIHHLETQLERLRPVPPGHAPPPSPPSLRPHARAIATGYGEVRRQIPVPLRPVSPYGWRYDAAGPGNAPPAVFQKNRDTAISLAAPGLSNALAENWVGCVKSTVCQWLGKAPLTAPQLPPDGTLEIDGLWTRTRSGRTELKVIRAAATGTALVSFGPWAEVIDRAWQLGAQRPQHLVSDGDWAIAAGIELVYGGEAPHQLSLLYLLREYRRNIGATGFAAARRLLAACSLAEGREWARRIMRASDGAARYWCEKALSKGLRHLATGQVEHRTTSRLERHNRELRREKLGAV